MARRKLTIEEQEQRDNIKLVAAASGIPFNTLIEWKTKKEKEDYRQFILFLLENLGVEKVASLRSKYNLKIQEELTTV